MKSIDNYLGSFNATVGSFNVRLGNAYFAMKSGKNSFSLMTGYTRADTRPMNVEQTNIAYQAEYISKSTTLGFTGKGDFRFIPVTANFSHEFNEKNQINIEATYSHSLQNMQNKTKCSYTDELGVENKYINSIPWNRLINPNYSINIDYHKLFKKAGHSLNFAYQYNRLPSSNNIINNMESLTDIEYYNRKYDTHFSELEHTFQLDYNEPLGENHRIGGGIKYIYRDNSNLQDKYFESAKGIWQQIESEKSWLYYLQHIYSAYGSYTFRHEIFSVTAGLRANYQ